MGCGEEENGKLVWEKLPAKFEENRSAIGINFERVVRPR
jgi:hypothetical protein